MPLFSDEDNDDEFGDNGQLTMDSFIETAGGDDGYYAFEAEYATPVAEELEKVWVIGKKSGGAPVPLLGSVPVSPAVSYRDGGFALPVDDIVVANMPDLDICAAKRSLNTKSSDLAAVRASHAGEYLFQLMLDGKLSPKIGDRFLFRMGDGGTEIGEYQGMQPFSSAKVALVDGTLVKGDPSQSCPK